MTTQSSAKSAYRALRTVLYGVFLGLLVAIGTVLAGMVLPILFETKALGGTLPAFQTLSSFLRSQTQTMGLSVAAATPAYWYASRAAGLVGYVLLWAVTAWGLLLSTKLAKNVVPAPVAMQLHSFLSILTLVFAGLHGLVLMGDSYINFNLANVIYPFASAYQPLWVGAGQVGFYLGLAVTISFYIRSYIGARNWRRLHYLSFLMYGLVTLHSVVIGSDSGLPAVRMMYFVTGASVLFLIFYRLLTLSTQRHKAGTELRKRVAVGDQ